MEDFVDKVRRQEKSVDKKVEAKPVQAKAEPKPVEAKMNLDAKPFQVQEKKVEKPVQPRSLIVFTKERPNVKL